MAFSRDDIASYEKQPQVKVENFDPWHPTTPTAEAKPAEPTPESTPAPKEETSASPAETPQVEPADGSIQAVEAESAPADPAQPESEAVADAEAGNEGSQPRRSEARERIEELVAERNSLRQYGEYLLDELKKQKQAGQPAPETAAPEADPAPTLEQFQFDPVAFSRAQNEWLDRQVAKRVESAVKQRESQREETSLQANFTQRAAELRKTKPDFDVVLSNPSLPTLARNAARKVISLEQGPEIAYHLAKNPDLATRIARMEPEDQIMAIGRIDAQLQAAKVQPAPAPKPAPAKRTVTQAPPPPKPVGNAGPLTEKPADVMSMDEWVAKDRARKIAEREAKKRMREAMR